VPYLIRVVAELQTSLALDVGLRLLCCTALGAETQECAEADVSGAVLCSAAAERQLLIVCCVLTPSSSPRRTS
jgi:hypothetical protein